MLLTFPICVSLLFLCILLRVFQFLFLSVDFFSRRGVFVSKVWFVLIIYSNWKRLQLVILYCQFWTGFWLWLVKRILMIYLSLDTIILIYLSLKRSFNGFVSLIMTKLANIMYRSNFIGLNIYFFCFRHILIFFSFSP